MIRSTRAILLTVGLVVSSVGVAAGPARADGPSSVAPAFQAGPASVVSAAQRPVAVMVPGSNQKIAVGQRLTFDGTGSSDPAGGKLRYEWRSSGVPQVASKRPKYSRTFNTAGRFLVKLTVINSAGRRRNKAIWVTVGQNQRPVAAFTPGADQTIEVGETLTFNGKASSDPDGGALQYQWRSTGVRGLVSRESTYSRTFDSPGRFLVRLTVVDAGNQRSTKSIWINVIQQGPPVVTVISKDTRFYGDEEVYLFLDEPFTFNASKSFDPDGGPLRYEWRFAESESGRSRVMSRNAKYTDEFDFLTFGDWPEDPNLIILTVTDDEGDSTVVTRPLVIGHFD